MCFFLKNGIFEEKNCIFYVKRVILSYSKSPTIGF